MKRAELKPEMEVAVVDSTGQIERATVLHVGGWRKGSYSDHDQGPDHVVVFSSGSQKNHQQVVTSRDILGLWKDHEFMWRKRRAIELRHEAKLAMTEYNAAATKDQLETVKAALETVGVGSGTGSVIENLDGTMIQSQALFLTSENALKLLPIIKQYALNELLD